MKMKMKGLLEDDTYRLLKKDPTTKITRDVNQRLKTMEAKGVMDRQTRLKLAPQHCLPPQIYGLPKIHKENRQLRPIVSSNKSPTYYLAKELSRILRPLAGKDGFSVHNSTHFVSTLTEVDIMEEDQMVSFDVSNLFTKVQIPEAVEITSKRQKEDNSLDERTSLSPEMIVDLLLKCLKTTSFQFGDNYYEQTEGAAIGSPLSPIVANLYMEYFEEKLSKQLS